ncbi:MAG: anhydro-N-acetylmuramic acid kinase, partial [Rhodospirillales bacterium]|nr:anhydro-N-acetylmuramic acid kinase [Rhodospirillales bacterium]
MLTAIGLMSGTSMDGVDAAIIRTDGHVVSGFGPFLTIPYDDAFGGRLRGILGNDPERSADAAAVAR